MKILVDYQTFFVQKYGGISRYHATINKYINELEQEHTSTILTAGCDNEYINPGGYHYLKHLNRKGGYRLLKTINQKLTQLKVSNFDVFHPTYNDPYFLQFKNLPPYIVTMHDLIPEMHHLTGKELHAINKKKIVEKAAGIIAISEATKTDFLNIYNYPEHKVHVIHHGYPEYFEKYKDTSLNNDKIPFILFVGLRSDYKNFSFFLTAFSKLPNNHGVQIRVVGALQTADEYELINTLGIKDSIVFENFVSEKELSALYNQALCFVFPSLIEGFGMPLLEAFISRCPVICTDIPIFKEIAADAAFYFEARELDSLTFAMERVINDSHLRDLLVKKGISRLKQFNWKSSALATLAAYKTII